MMIRLKRLRNAARVLLSAFLVAYATVALHAYAWAPQAQGGSMVTEAMADAISGEADREEHCNEKATGTSALLCKYHCQSEVQTGDRPNSSVTGSADQFFFIVPHLEELGTSVPAIRQSLLFVDLAHHGGSPPPYASTSRLRI